MSKILPLLRFFGIDPKVGLSNACRIPKYLGDRRRFISALDKNAWPEGRLLPYLLDKAGEAGRAKGHYFHQDLLVAQMIHQNAPERHIDVGSRLDGFVAHVASFRKIEVLDIRPITSEARNIQFRQADIIDLPAEYLASADSVSCLHTIEHVGLGRYGDQIDPLGYEKAFASLASMVRPAGRLYISVPIGPQRIEFNAHRVFSPSTLIALAETQFELDEFSFVDDDGALHAGASPEAAKCVYGCGIYVFRKRAVSP